MKNLMKNTLLAIGIAALGAMPALAEPIAFTGAKIITSGKAGTIENGTLVIDNGRIVAVGPNVTIPAGAKVINASGKTITAGLIEADSPLGFVEVSSLGNDMASANDAFSASFEVQYGFDPDSELINVARIGGITRAIALPAAAGGGNGDAHAHDGAGAEPHIEANLFGGLGAVVDLSGEWGSVYRTRVAETVDLSGDGAKAVKGSRGVAYRVLQTIFDDVRHYKTNRAAYAKGEGRDLHMSLTDIDALVPVVDGKIPLVVRVERASDILNVLAFAKAQGIKVILVGASEGWKVADAIAAAKAPVILNATANLPENFEMLGARLDNAALLAKAGVKVIITGSDGASTRARETRYNAGNAAAHGLSYDEAIRAITSNPAEAFGLSDLGSVEAGKIADIVIWSGDPLEPLTRAEAVYINGVSVPLTSRAYELRDRYKNGEGAMPHAYSGR